MAWWNDVQMLGAHPDIVRETEEEEQSGEEGDRQMPVDEQPSRPEPAGDEQPSPPAPAGIEQPSQPAPSGQPLAAKELSQRLSALQATVESTKTTDGPHAVTAQDWQQQVYELTPNLLNLLPKSQTRTRRWGRHTLISSRLLNS